MLSVSIIDGIDSNLWDSLAVHPCQSWGWGESRLKNNIEILRIGIFHDKELRDVFLITLQPYLGKKLAFIGMSKIPSVEVINFIKSISKKYGIFLIKFEPYIFKDKKNVQDQMLKNGFHQSQDNIFYHWTSIINLTDSEEDLLTKMKKQSRYSIRVAEKNNVTISIENNQKGFNSFIKLYLDTVKRQGFLGFPEIYHQNVWDSLKGNIAYLLIAKVKNIPINASELFYFNETLFYPYAGNSYENRNLMGANLLMLEAIRLGKKLGAKKFDLWGVNSPGFVEKSAWHGFSKFKESFGGDTEELIGSFNLSVNKLWYFFYNVRFKYIRKIKTILKV